MNTDGDRRGLGWLKDPPDRRDRPYAPATATLEQTLPETVDLRGQSMPKIRDQGHLGSCTANAATTVVEFAERHDHDPDHDALSRLWTYWYSRQKIGTTGSDSGSFIRDAFKVLAERGAPRERYWPYDLDRFRDEPTAGERSAPHHRVLEYRSINDSAERDMRACLAEGYPFAFGFAVYESFWDVGADGAWWPGPNEAIDGYHAVVCVGYDDDQWIVRNSWGAGWGDGGYFYVPRGFMATDAYDCWTVRKVTWDPVPA